MKRDKTIHIDQAQEGMILAQDIFGSNGKCLLNAKTSLDTDTLARLKCRGIKNLIIIDDQQLSKKEILALRENCIKVLDHRFRQVQHVSSMKHLKEILLKYHLEKFD